MSRRDTGDFAVSTRALTHAAAHVARHLHVMVVTDAAA